ncbi:MAG: L,D-transpeptidase family protein [Candidatus Ornithomonoglobus sp.]
MFFRKHKTDEHSIDEGIEGNVEIMDGAEADGQSLTETESEPNTGESENIIEDDGQEETAQQTEEKSTENEQSDAVEEEIDDFDVVGDEWVDDAQAEMQEEPQNTEEPQESAQPAETDEERAERLEKRRRILKKTAKISGIAIGGILVIYLAGAAFYNSHFFFGTIIGNYNCSNMSLSKAEEHITTGIENYSFAIYENNGVVENIKGEEVGLATVSRESIEDIKAKQNPFRWPFPGNQRVIPMSAEISLDDELLKSKISALKCVQESNAQMDGAIAGIYYDENDKVYHVKDDGTHSIVSERALFEKISGGMKGLYAEMNVAEEGLYGGLEIDDRMNDTLWILNNCLNTVVTYQRGEETTVLDRGTIHTLLSVADDYSVVFNDDAIASFVNDLAAIYNTVGTTRTFMGSGGEEVSVSGGDYGWKVDQNKEIAELKEAILAGQPVTREPAYSRTAGSHGPNNDFPNTYVEVSIAAQHLWYYKNGELIISSDVVTGNPYAGNGTHTGVYYLKYKEKNATLVGDNYQTPVSFWMPFNGGEGLHDATWRGAFGGRIYMGGGSHGCVNCPYSTAQALFENVQQGDPVIVY